MDKYQNIALEILEAMGGHNNILSYTNCMTRLRITPVNRNQINEESLKKINGILGIVDDDTYQIILGPGVVAKVAKQFHMISTQENDSPLDSTLSFTEDLQIKGAKMKAEQKKKNSTPFKSALKKIGNIFITLIPAFVGAGLIAGITSILQNNMTVGTLNSTTWQPYITILNIITNSLFSYLVIYVGINAAKEFGATPSLGGIIGGVTLLTGMPTSFPINNIFNDEPLLPGQGGVLGVLLAVWILSVFEKQLRKWIPDAIDIIVIPTIVLLIVGLITIFLLMPFAGFLSDKLILGIDWVLEHGSVLSGMILGMSFLPLVMLGLHQVLIPIHIEMIHSSGATQLLPMLSMAGAGQVGAAIALWVRCKKNTKLTNVIKSALPVGILGIGEPLIYGVTLPLGRPFITACIGGGIGGAVIGLLKPVGAIAIGPSGMALVPLIANGEWLKYIIGLIVGYIAGFILTYLFGIPKEVRTT
ncbi:PTS transporter subunit EIIC [Bacillus cereus]|uniref:PTS transporter subunit EIIC n=1 Tax=Bacillus cereus TaxID=1396 RepID=UPI0018CEE569|nr:PTS transporter subunit EIIC [Bacillus cereus]MBG9613506.1 permease [Bacillus cereus]